jgi:hypothetical protein
MNSSIFSAAKNGKWKMENSGFLDIRLMPGTVSEPS